MRINIAGNVRSEVNDTTGTIVDLLRRNGYKVRDYRKKEGVVKIWFRYTTKIEIPMKSESIVTRLMLALETKIFRTHLEP